MPIVVLACSDPVLSQLIEREDFAEIWVIDPPEKKCIFKLFKLSVETNIFKLSRQIFLNCRDKYFQTPQTYFLKLTPNWLSSPLVEVRENWLGEEVQRLHRESLCAIWIKTRSLSGQNRESQNSP